MHTIVEVVVVAFLLLHLCHAQIQTNRVGFITTFAGAGEQQIGDGSNAAFASFTYPRRIVFDQSNNLMYIVDAGNNRIRVVDMTSKQIDTVAGDGKQSFAGDNGIAQFASLSHPFDIAIDSKNNMLFIADTNNHRIRAVNRSTNIITTIVGNGMHRYSGDGGLAPFASLNSPSGLVFDSANNLLYIADTNNNRIRVVDRTTNIITTVAGNGRWGSFGDGKLATNASLNLPFGMSIDYERNLLYIADSRNHRIRVVNCTSNIITTIAGGSPGGFFFGDGINAKFASLNSPRGVTIDSKNNLLYIADTANHRIRVVNCTTNIITTVAGSVGGFFGDGNLAINASILSPNGIGIDYASNLIYVADAYNHRIRVIDCYTQLIASFTGLLHDNVIAHDFLVR